jgi:hypothetical protein
LAQLQAAKAQLAELEARLLVHAERVELPARSGTNNTGNWHARQTRTTRVTAHRAVRLAHGLDTHDLTRTALAEGRLLVEQAEAILRAIADLPDDLDPVLVARAEEHLIGEAGHHDAKTLKILGQRLLEVVAPEAADAHHAQLLEREERDAEAATRLTMWEDGRGKVHGRFTLDGLTGAMFKRHLWALASPRHQAATGRLGERRPSRSGWGGRSPS